MPASSYPPNEDRRTYVAKFHLTREEKAELIQRARDKGKPQAEVVREALQLSDQANPPKPEG